MNSSDSAEEIVRLTLEGTEVAFKILGAGAKNIAVMLYTITQNKQTTKGKTRLTNMLKIDKPLRIFPIKAENLKEFSRIAKKYGVAYCALTNIKDSKIDGMVDLLIKEDDAAKINRIAERFNLIDISDIENSFKLERDEKTENTKSKTELLIDEIMPIEENTPSNNIEQHSVEKSQSDTFLNTKASDKIIASSKTQEKKSVKQELKEIQEELNKKSDIVKEEKVIPVSKEKQKKEIKIHTKETHKGKHLKEPKHLDISNSNRKKKKRGRSK